MADRRVTCSVDGCARPRRTRGWCPMHYGRWLTTGDPLAVLPPTGGPTRKPPTDRFWAKVDKSEPHGCWPWTASRFTNGYGQFWDGERKLCAHQYAYGLLVGPIPEGLELDHLCCNRGCVNPSHLEPVTHQENCRRVHMRAGHQ